MVSNLIGGGQARRIGELMRAVIWPTHIISTPFLLAALLAPGALLSVFTSDPDEIHASMAGLRVVALAVLVVIPADMWFAAVVGTGTPPPRW